MPDVISLSKFSSEGQISLLLLICNVTLPGMMFGAKIFGDLANIIFLYLTARGRKTKTASITTKLDYIEELTPSIDFSGIAEFELVAFIPSRDPVIELLPMSVAVID